MARTTNPKNSEWIVGPVRVVARGDRYRVLWTENGKQRERSAQTLDRAKEIAVEEMGRLELLEAAGGGTSQRVAFGSLIADVLIRKESSWSPEWAAYNERMARLSVLPAIGAHYHDQVTPGVLQGLLNDLHYQQGKSHSYLSHCRKLLRAAVLRGVDLGLYQADKHPLKGVSVPNLREVSHADLIAVGDNDGETTFEPKPEVMYTHPGFDGMGSVPGCRFLIDYYQADGGIVGGRFEAPAGSYLESEFSSMYVQDLLLRFNAGVVVGSDRQIESEIAMARRLLDEGHSPEEVAERINEVQEEARIDQEVATATQLGEQLWDSSFWEQDRLSDSDYGPEL